MEKKRLKKMSEEMRLYYNARPAVSIFFFAWTVSITGFLQVSTIQQYTTKMAYTT